MDYYVQYKKYLKRYLFMKGGQKKKWFYHGSPNKLNILEPQSKNTAVIEGEGAVFATNTKWLGIFFIASGATDSDIELGFIDGMPYILEQYDGAFDKFLKGKSGYLHYVDPKYFKSDERLGMPQHEFISYEPVPIMKVEKIDDIYEELEKEVVNILTWEDKQRMFGMNYKNLEWDEIEKILFEELKN